MFDDSDYIYRQIESTAGLHEPAVYGLLSFYQSFEKQPETLDGRFIPLTTVQLGRPEETKIFAIGLIPPSFSGGLSRIIDRSGTVRAEGSYADLLAANPDVGSSSTGDLPGQTSGISTSTPAPVGPTQTDSPEFFEQFVAMCNRLGCEPEELAKVIQSESGWNEHASNGVAKGLIQIVKTTACGALDPKNPPKRTGGLGMTEAEYATFENSSRVEQLKWIEKFYRARARGKNAGELKLITFGGYNNPDGSIWSSTATPTAPDFKPFKKAEFQRKAYQINHNVDKVPDPKHPDRPVPKGYITVADLTHAVAKHKLNPSVLDGIQKAREKLGMGSPAPLVCAPDAPATEVWQGTGSKDANDAAKCISQVAGKDLNQTDLGKLLTTAQEVTARLMREAVEQIAKTPPLRMLVNPQSLRVSSEKLISSGNRGRNGPIIEHWGDQQDKIEGSGKIAAFYSMDAEKTGGPGLSRTTRQYSTSYQNFLSLFLLYKNNGGVWFPDPLQPATSKVQNLSVVGSVYLYYDNILYIGSFDNLSVNESDDAPFTLDYSFSFTVRGWYLLDHLDDQAYTYQSRPTSGLATTGIGGSPLQGGNNAQPSPSVPLPPEIGRALDGALDALDGPKLDPRKDPLFGITAGDIGDNLEGL